MRQLVKTLGLLLILAVSLPNVGVADDKPSNALRTMATITYYLNHFPGDVDKGKLRDIANNAHSPKYEQVLASAMLNLHHKAIASDKPKLMAIVNDDSAPLAARDLAKILHNLSHKPTATDKKVLKQYIW